MVATEPLPKPRPRRRGWVVLIVSLALLALALHWFSRPQRVADLILAQAGDALGLEITAAGASDYRLFGVAMLVIRDVVVREPKTQTVVLRAERLLLELPWSTIRSRGADLTAKRIELDAPVLDLAALQRWQASRPPAEPARLPRLTDGLRIVRGEVVGDGWRVQGVDVDLPLLDPDRPVRTHLVGRVVSGTLQLPFDVHAGLTRPVAGAGLGIVGRLEPQSPPWSLPMHTTLSGRLHNGDDGIGLDALRLGADASYRNAGTDVPFTLGLAGPVRFHEGRLRLPHLGLTLWGAGVVPKLQGAGSLTFGDTLDVRLQGALQSWPRAWPALPAPLSESTSPLPFLLDYRGRADLSEPVSLRLSRDGTRFDGRLRVPVVLQWIDTFGRHSPLPPLEGRLSSPKLEIAGATLEGVEVEFHEGAAP